MDTSNDTLTCTKCGNEYPATPEYFKPDKRNRTGFSSWCKACHRDYNKRYYDKNLERERARKLDYRNANSERARETSREYHRTHKDADREQMRRWRAANHERSNEIARQTYRRHRDRYLAKFKEHYRKHPEKFRLQSVLRKSRVRNMPTAFTRKDWRYALAYFDNRCAACGRPEDMWTRLAADHWIPVTSADCPGTIPTNIVPLCHAMPGVPAGEPCCNQSKFNHDPLKWLQKRFGKREAKRIAKRVQEFFETIS